MDTEARPIRNRALTALLLPFVAAVLVWSVWLLDVGFDWHLGRYGLLPRTPSGLVGILTAPLLHADLDHLFNNTVAMLMLGWCLMYFYPRIAGRVVVASWLVSGIGVWFMGRANYHIGASGVIYGIAAFLFVSGLLRKQRTLMALSMLVVFLYGGLIWGVFPIVERLSWESHLWGGLAGVAMAFLHRSIPPAVSDPKPSFADEEDSDEDERTGDEQALRAGIPEERLAAPGDRPWNVNTTWDPGR